MHETTRVTENGRTTIPKELCEKYDIEPGDEVVWVSMDDGLLIRKRTRTEGRGLLVPDDTSRADRGSVVETLSEHIRTRRDAEYEER